MSEYCDIAFIVDHKRTVEEFLTDVRHLSDYYDVWIDLSSLEIDYEPNGVPQCHIEGEMPGTELALDKLIMGIEEKSIEGFTIDYDTMREWIE